MLKGFTKAEKSWMMYDWAHSAHSVIIVTLLPIFYQTINATNPEATATWGYSTSFSMILVALLSPFLGALGDFKGNRKKILTIFMVLGVLSVGLIATTPMMVYTQSVTLVSAVIIGGYILSQIGYSGANVMYDSLLTDVTTEDRMDKVSVMGYGLGYIGGSTIPLVVFFILTMVWDMTGALMVAFALTAVWWLVFSIPILKDVKQINFVERKRGAVRETFSNLGKTAKEIYKNKPMLVFILAYFFYIDGVNTIIHMSTIYGSSLGLGTTEMMLALLLTQLMGLPFAMIYVKLSEKFGTKAMIGAGIVVYFFVCIYAYYLKTVFDFWVLAVAIGTSQGGIQALSRSYFSKLIPDKDRAGEFFGFFDVFGRFSSFIGPAIFAFVTTLVRSNLMEQQGLTAETLTAETSLALSKASNPFGVLSILALFIIGGGLFGFVLPKVQQKVKA